MTTFKVLICGGGIAGHALAFWLSKMHHNVTLVERFPALRASGLQLDLRGHGVEVLKRMGLEQTFRTRAVEEQGLELVDKHGKRKAFFPVNRNGKGVQSLSTEHEIMRGDFVQILHDVATEHGTSYMFGTTVQKFENSNNGVDVVFSSGKAEHFDLLVGADGQNSHTRKMMLGPEVDDPIEFVGQCIAYFTYVKPAKPGEEYVSTVYIAPGRRSFMMRRSSPEHLQVYLFTQEETMKDVKKGDVKAEKAKFVEFYQGAGAQTEEILKGLQDSDDFYCERPGVVRLNPWYRDRVVMVGDAAYGPTVNTGMGTTSSMVGAYILAGEISKQAKSSSGGAGDLRTALEAYDTKFRPFMDQVQRGLSKGNSGWESFPSSEFGIMVMNFLIGLAASLRFDVLAKLALREKVMNWSLPDYDEMVSGKQ